MATPSFSSMSPGLSNDLHHTPQNKTASPCRQSAHESTPSTPMLRIERVEERQPVDASGDSSSAALLLTSTERVDASRTCLAPQHEQLSGLSNSSRAAGPYAHTAHEGGSVREDAYSVVERRFRAQHSPHNGLLRPSTSQHMFTEVTNDTTNGGLAPGGVFKVKVSLDGAFMLNAEEQLEIANIIVQLAPSAKRNSEVFYKTRWMSLGVHYDWGERAYVPNATCPLPERLKTMSAQVAQLCSLPHFAPDAALVNFYHPCQRPSDRLGGHKDDVENHMDQPLVALSLGPPCCFLLGGATRDDEPVPLLIRGGDVLVMSGPSRHAVHGVPKVWPFEESRKRKRTPMKEFPSGSELISHTRVNISLRLV
eukprot:GEMP01041220.1.p1 GENE.GEMP01041220.1~~GEMP01041220.1.p1  ORF type:complete len:366 (+),score=85.41 GEMP01041220.1:120-1217(+)